MSLIITACPLIGCANHEISLLEYDWLILNYGVIHAKARELWIWAQAQVIDRGPVMPAPGNENFVELSPDNGNMQRPFVIYCVLLFSASLG